MVDGDEGQEEALQVELETDRHYFLNQERLTAIAKYGYYQPNGTINRVTLITNHMCTVRVWISGSMTEL